MLTLGCFSYWYLSTKEKTSIPTSGAFDTSTLKHFKDIDISATLSYGHLSALCYVAYPKLTLLKGDVTT